MFWNKSKCPECRRNVERDWHFCPRCGAELVAKARPRDVFEAVERAFEDFDRTFSPHFFRFPRIRFPAKGGGVSITITSATGRKPEVKVSTFGDYKQFEPEIKRRLGVTPSVKEVEVKARVPKVTEEPEMSVEKLDDRQVWTFKLPGVKSIDDVDVRKLEQSIEVRAFTNDKAYFKLIPVKPEVQVLDKRLEDGKLKIEIG